MTVRGRKRDIVGGTKVDMTCANPAPMLVKFSLPIVVGLVFTQLYNMTDATIAGYLVGGDSVAAIGACSALYVLLFGLVTALNQGYSIVVARLFGDKSPRMIKKASAIIFGYNAVGTVLFTACGWLLTTPILKLFGTPTELLDSSTRYLTTVLLGIGFCSFYYMFACIITALGNSRVPLYFLLLGLVCNIGFSLLFMGVFSLGVFGAALGTLTAQAVVALLIIMYTVKNYRQYIGFFYGFNPYRSPLAREILYSGLCMALVNSTIALGTVATQPAINHLGASYVAGYSVARRIFVLFSQPMVALSLAMTTFVGQNYGAGKYRRIGKGVNNALIVCLILGLGGLVLYIFGHDIAQLLSGHSDVEVTSNAFTAVRWTAPFLVFFGISSVLKSSLQALQCRKDTLKVSLIELLLRSVAVVFFAKTLGFVGIVAVEPILWVLTGGVLFGVWRRKNIAKTT